jgi:transcriptional regulator GlxA family with amidase domain
MSKNSNNASPSSFGFLLLNDFSLISFSSALEPLRMTNRLCRQELYRWKIISETGDAVRASDGLSVNVDYSFEDEDVLNDLDVVIVCGGRRVEQNIKKSVSVWLRLVDQSGIGLGATCTGSHILAEAGLLDGYRCTIHWENLAVLTHLFPNVAVTQRVFTIDRNRYTSSGGTAPVDLMLSIITERCGREVSVAVADQFILERIRQSDDQQRVPIKHVVGRQSRRLVVAIELMEANIREPLSQEDLTTFVGLSRRQLQRLFQRYLNCSPSRYYLQLRLQRARELLRQTGMGLVEVADLTGFASSSHFSKRYKERYGHSPSFERQIQITERSA